MTALIRETRLLLGLRAPVLALLGLFLLTAAAIGAGLTEIARQNAVIVRVAEAQKGDVRAISDWVSKLRDAGDAAYYTPHATWDAPSDLAFAALGTRDIAPFVLRVRALGLEAQLYEGDIGNPETALPGRFDFAFVLVYLAPLFVIALFHDLRSGEREAGRLRSLEAASGSGARLWAIRALVRGVLLFAALILPFLVGAAIAHTAAWKQAAILLLALLYLVFWISVSLVIGRAQQSSLANAMTLAATWLVLTLVVPAVGHVAINAAAPVRQGMELSLLQRNAVHRAWDIPKSTTMDAFVKTHPEWAAKAQVTGPFHWKWYFAFHQVGDQSVADMAQAYSQGVLRRASLSEGAGLVVPGIGVQLALHRLADTDTRAQMAYLDQIRLFHAQLRRFYYPYLFNEAPFVEADFGKAPVFVPRRDIVHLPTGLIAGLAVMALVSGVAAARTLRRSDRT